MGTLEDKFDAALSLIDDALNEWQGVRERYNLTDEMVEEGKEIIRLAKLERDSA